MTQQQQQLFQDNLVSRYQNVFILYFTGTQDNGGDGDNWSYKMCKASVKSSPLTKQHPTFYRPDALPVTQLIVSKHYGRKYHIHGLAHCKLTCGSSNLVSIN